jgi:hypothetical protein
LQAFEYFYVGRGCGSPEFYSVGPDWFQYNFVDEEFVVYRVFLKKEETIEAAVKLSTTKYNGQVGTKHRNTLMYSLP